MDVDLKVAEFIATFFQWQEDHPGEAKELCFEFLEATDTTLNFRAKGMLFQLLLPAGLLQSEIDPGETFIAMSLDNSAPNRLMVSLNEKLERVPIGQRALAQGLDVFASILISFDGKRKRPQADQGVQRPNGKGLLHTVGFAIEHSRDLPTVRDSRDEKQSYDSDTDSSSDDGLDLSNRGYFRGMIREARDRCEAARQRSIESVLSMPVEPKNVLLHVDDILHFCDVSSKTDFQVSLQAEVAGFVNDVKIASSLGLSCSKAIQIFMEFERGDAHKPLTLSRVKVDPEPSGSGNFAKALEGALVETDKGSDEEFEAECKKFSGRQRTVAYGTSVLLPDLIETFFRHRSGETNLRSIPWENNNLDLALRSFAAVENPFIGLICFIASQLKALSTWCTVCWSQLPSSVWRLRTCHKDLCLYEFEELGLGARIHHEIQESPEVVEFELSLACAAASSERDVFEPFPSFLLLGREERGRSGWFSGKPNRGKGVARADKAQDEMGVRENWGKEPSLKQKYNKRLSLLLEVLQSIPSIADMRDCADENALKKMLSKVAFSIWRKSEVQVRSEQFQMWLSYELMRFILSTNRSSLRIMAGGEDLGLSIPAKFQFVVLHDSPEKEAIFEQRRAEKGSFFAFHGSGFCNWYSILRNGLRTMSNTEYMSTGAAHGQGIYLSDNFNLSCQYATTSYGHWKNGTLKEGAIVVAICEVVKGSPKASVHSIYVVPPGQEENISVRYLLVLGGSNNAKTWCQTRIIGCTLKDSKHSIDLRVKYDRLKTAEQTRQQQILLDERMDAFVRIKGDGSCPKTDTRSGDKSPTVDTAEASCSASPGSEGESSSSKRGESTTTSDEQYCRYKAVLDSNFSTPPTSRRVKENSSANARPALPASATHAISKEFKNVQNEIRESKRGLHNDSFLANITIDIPDETDLSIWHVYLSQNLFTSFAKLYKDLQKLAVMKKQPETSVLLEVTFSGMYPFEPPFIRLVRPKFLFHTGHVTVGGSICMELLTATGWLPSFSFESVLVQIVNAFVEGEGRVDMKAIGQEYSKQEAQSAFTRVAGLHGWTVSSRRK